jgi:hypothetical protein
MTVVRTKISSEPAIVSGSSSFLPPPINKVEDTGLSPLWLQDLALKILKRIQSCRRNVPAFCGGYRPNP